ncbi:MAG TPA: hypothetical protein VKU92_09030 [Acidimicrobiales bacterium]|nr:hypothetical protein [Acidimicrobiales bacterium]
MPTSWVFWIEAATSRSPFSTRGEDHGNCSLGRFTHGLPELDPSREDVRALLGSGRVTPEMLPQIPPAPTSPCAVTDGLLGDAPARSFRTSSWRA